MPADADFVADLLAPSLVVGVWLAATFVSLTVSVVEGIADAESGLASGLIYVLNATATSQNNRSS